MAQAALRLIFLFDVGGYLFENDMFQEPMLENLYQYLIAWLASQDYASALVTLMGNVVLDWMHTQGERLDKLLAAVPGQDAKEPYPREALAAIEAKDTPVPEGQTTWAGVLCDWLLHERTLRDVYNYFTLEPHYTVSAVCRYLIADLQLHPDRGVPMARAIFYFWRAKTEIQSLSRQAAGSLPAEDVAVTIRAPDSF